MDIRAHMWEPVTTADTQFSNFDVCAVWNAVYDISGLGCDEGAGVEDDSEG